MTHTHKARLTYSWAPGALVDGKLVRNRWFTIYGRDGSVLLETQDAEAADCLADDLPEILSAEPETPADSAIDLQMEAAL
jgi:hypothetical protein